MVSVNCHEIAKSPYLNLRLVAGAVSVDCQVFESIVKGGAVAELNWLCTEEAELLVECTIGGSAVECGVEGVCDIANVEGNLRARDIGSSWPIIDKVTLAVGLVQTRSAEDDTHCARLKLLKKLLA